jgi:thioredoxin-like negative regulator of GroEL
VKARALAVLGVVGALASCARPVVKAPQPEAEALVFPAPLPGEATPAEIRHMEKAWKALTAGNASRAEKLFRELLAAHPGFIPAETGLAYARLRAGRDREAARALDAVLERRPDYAPALLAAAGIALRMGHPESALVYYQRIPSGAGGIPEPQLRRKLAEVRLQATERRMADARLALDEGDGDRAIEIYRLALVDAPELSGLRLELSGLLLQAGDLAEATAVLEEDPAGDRQVLLRLAELLTENGEHARALEAYRRILARDPKDEDVARRSHETRRAMELLKMPEEYRRILDAPTITRADLAALVSVKVTALAKLRPSGGAVAVDISGSWAREHIIRMLGLGILGVYPNHTFQPAATVRRGDMARAIKAILDGLRYPATPVPTLADMSTANVYYAGAARAVSAGLMDLTPDGAFQAWRPVSGPEAVSVLESLVRLVGP